MVTSTSRRFFFIHVMKTAGTTLARHLQRQFPPIELYPSRGYDWELVTDLEPYISVPRLTSVPEERREQIRIYTGHFPYMAAALVAPDLRTLTLLREPVDRTVSVLKHFKRREERFRTSTLEEIYDDPQISRRYIQDYQTKIFSFTPADNVHTVQQPMAVDDSRLARARENLARVEFVGLTESFGEFVEELRSSLGWWPDGVDAGERTNKSPEAWSAKPALLARIADENPYEVEFYRFARDLVERRRQGP